MNCRELDEAIRTIANLRASIRVNLMTTNAGEAQSLLADGPEPYVKFKWIHPSLETTTDGYREAELAEALQQLVICRDRCRFAETLSYRDTEELREWTSSGKRAIRRVLRWRLNA